MIGSLKGIVVASGEDRALIEVQGVGYLVFAGAKTLSRLGIGGAVHLFVETQMREDSLKLFGFLSDSDRAWFARLQEISGVGAKVALSILDVLGPAQLMEAAALEDKVSIARANGVGPKLAARIAIELKGRPPPTSLLGASTSIGSSEGGMAAGAPLGQSDSPPMPDIEVMAERNQAISALMNLGISQPEALRAVAVAGRTLGDDATVGALVKAALKDMSK
jgi:holliday junction DNA helicase RuvA